MTAPEREIRIVSVGTELPGEPVDNAALARFLGMDTLWEQWVDAFIGTRSRHMATDLATGELRHSLADLCAAAGRRALAAAGLESGPGPGPGDGSSPADGAAVDLVVLGTATPDQLMPATVNMVAERLGVNDVSTFQLQSGCTGAIQALDVAHQLLLAGRHETALVLGGDVCTRIYDVTTDFAALPPAELVNAALFGDGAGAAVLTARPGQGGIAIRHVLTRLTGLGRPPGQVLEWFTRSDRGSDRPAASEDYKAIEASVPVLAGEIVDELLDTLEWKVDELDYLLPPQLSGRMTARIVEHLGLDGPREISCVERTGNNGNALPFLQLERLLELATTGDRAAVVAVESSKWIKGGLAVERL